MPFLSSTGEPLQNPYELLRLTHGATDEEISKSYKKLMLHLHPDKQPPGQSVEEAMRVERLMYDVMKARSFLLDVEYMASRRQYDSKLILAKQQPRQPPPLPPKSNGVKHDKHLKNDHHVSVSKQHQQEEEEVKNSKKTELLSPKRSSSATTAAADVGGWGLRPTKSWRTSQHSKDPTAADDDEEAITRMNIKYNGKEKSRQRRSTMSNDTSYGEDKPRQQRRYNTNMNIKRLGTVRKSSSLIRRTAVSANANKKKVDNSNEKEKEVTTINNVKRWGKAKQSSSSLRRAANVKRKVDSSNNKDTTRNGIT